MRIKWLFKNIIRCIRAVKKEKYETVIIGGGQLVLSNTYFPIAMFTWVTIIKLLTKSKIKLFAVGSGEGFTILEKILYRSALKRVDDIYIRDFTSIEFIKKNFMLFPKYVPDPVFIISTIYKTKSIRSKRSKSVLIGAVDYGVYKRYNINHVSEEDYMKFWVEKAIEFSKKGYNIELFYTTLVDMYQTNKLKILLLENHNINLKVLKITTLPELQDVILNSSIIVSARMHALIIGYSYNIKIIPFVISDKIKAFKNEYLDVFKSKDEVSKLILNGIEDVIENKQF